MIFDDCSLVVPQSFPQYGFFFQKKKENGAYERCLRERGQIAIVCIRIL